MKKRNPIATVLRLRQIIERKKRADLGVAQAELADAEETLAQRRARLLRSMHEGAELPPALLRALHLQGIDSVEHIELAAREVESATQRMLNERSEWQAAAADLDATEELERRQKRNHAIKARAASERALDEIMAARYRRKDAP